MKWFQIVKELGFAFTLFLGASFAIAADEQKPHSPHKGPASTVETHDFTIFKAPNDKKWFSRAQVSLELPTRTVLGAGVAVAYYWKSFFVDLDLKYYKTQYGGLRIYQTGIVNPDTLLSPESEVGRRRHKNEAGTLYTAGFGSGYFFRLFESEHWVEMGRFAASYARYFDDVNRFRFQGGIATFEAGIAYLWRSLAFGPSVTWNVGYLRKIRPEPDSDIIVKDGFLPIQWWSVQLSVYAWMF